MITQRFRFLICVGLFYLGQLASQAHEEPTSFLDLKLTPTGISATLVASTMDVSHDLEQVEPAMLLKPDVIQQQQPAIEKIIQSRLKLTADGQLLKATSFSITPVPERKDLRLEWTYPAAKIPQDLSISCQLFPYDARHRTYLNVFQGKSLIRQEVFDVGKSIIPFSTQAEQSLWEVVREFTYEGVHHIFIGPDHILFIVGLLLLGGSIGQLLKIITAFTIAHSVTLGLATFQIFSPSPSWVEPIIALSIVVVGVHAYLRKKGNDPRLLFAFGFGLIHGFGFANVLQEMELPASALGVALFCFNLGVELGQCCIILLIAPALAYLTVKKPVLARQCTAFAALMITTVGAFWFFERVL
jgi:hydrogenase/urease accessory protein HupE